MTLLNATLLGSARFALLEGPPLENQLDFAKHCTDAEEARCRCEQQGFFQLCSSFTVSSLQLTEGMVPSR
jgi:hypothetical protein